MRILAHEQRTGGALNLAVLTDCLRNRQYVGLGECAIEGRAAVSAGPEADQFRWVAGTRFAFEILALQFAHVDQDFFGRGLAGVRVNRHIRFDYPLW